MRRLCSKCEEPRDAAEFSPSKTAADGLSSWCHECKKLQARRYNRANREAIAAKMAAHRAANPEKVKEQRKKCYDKDPAKRVLATTEWQKKNPDKVRGYAERRRPKENEKRQHKYETDHDYREWMLAYQVKWRKQNKDKRARYGAKRRLAKLGANGVTEEVSREEVLKRAGGCCVYCAEPVTLKTMHSDHATPLSRGGPHTYDNVVASCRSCNLRKGTKTAEEFVAGRKEAA